MNWNNVIMQSQQCNQFSLFAGIKTKKEIALPINDRMTTSTAEILS